MPDLRQFLKWKYKYVKYLNTQLLESEFKMPDNGYFSEQLFWEPVYVFICTGVEFWLWFINFFEQLSKLLILYIENYRVFLEICCINTFLFINLEFL